MKKKSVQEIARPVKIPKMIMAHIPKNDPSISIFFTVLRYGTLQIIGWFMKYQETHHDLKVSAR